ncbi:MAG TPA: hypothetical protein VGH14_00795 [Solirubrobacterales bacterium]|jgi:hypothetical protein
MDTTNPNGEPDGRVAALGEIVDRLIDVVVRIDDETSATAAANFDPDVPRVAGHKATAEDLTSLRQDLDALRKAGGKG